MSEQNKFQIGDTVTWTSQAGGRSKTKQGIVIAEIPGDSRIRLKDALPAGFTVRGNNGLRPLRDHASYLIQVGKSKRLYWPLVKYLERVEPELMTVAVPASTLNTETGARDGIVTIEATGHDDDPMWPGEGCGYDAEDVGDGSSPDL